MPNVGPYTFDEEPFCGYPETVTLTNLPTFLTHNEDSSDFTVQESSDLSLIGEYTVNIKSEIRPPKGPWKVKFHTFEVSYDFLVVIEPCIVDNYEVLEAAANIAYIIGFPDLRNVSPYSF